ncbi:PfkB family carbohydrate kinase [Microbacterium sp. SD291]|uniref:PfkB family carbohydrate kinase n=1 Tax=Microbacterium sp. SD291 TaxID=2782007 RepID=UPI001A95BD10|nr:PfkB family carbohydrate kinase [Microbacterium sp. SD291]MBO0981246.1 bifunctional hydroxymethylpyrimidine kinase/phosphomethylpyrimidine kinase [Microbacterium sp. SD291]
MSDVTIFAPSPTLTVTVEDHPQGSEIHVHAGGQGVWQARMLRRLDTTVTICCALTGEVGVVLRHLLEDEEVSVVAVERAGRGSAYLHDRRGGERVVIAEEDGDPIGRHDLDDLYGAVLRSAADSPVVILSGPSGDSTLPADLYRRLAIDLRGDGRTIVADLSGERLGAVIEGRVDVVKVSHEELIADGLAADASVHEVSSAMRAIRDRGVGAVIATRASEPLLLLDERGVVEVSLRKMAENETRGAGDSLTAGVAAALARGGTIREAVALGAAAGALNVTRHGLGTGDSTTILQLRESVVLRELEHGDDADAEGRVSPDGLAALAGPSPRSGHDQDAGEDPPGRDEPAASDEPHPTTPAAAPREEGS